MSRRGMTLVEMLVAMTATLLLMAAVAQAFAVFGSAITGSRGVLDLDARMRNAAWRLRSDLAGATVRPLPPIAPETAQGYLEIIEGPFTDSVFRNEITQLPSAIQSGTTPVGPTDVDDVLLFTTQSLNPPFVGRAPGSGQTFESTVAEVAWFARPTPGTSTLPTYTLYRKQLLVMGYVGVAPFSNSNTNSVDWATAGSSWSAFYNLPCDVSVRREGNTLVPNTLADLSRREARFLHSMSGMTAFPYLFLSGSAHQAVVVGNPTQLPAALAGLTFDPVLGVDDDGDTTTDEAGERAPRQGEDVVLTDVIAFDVRVFDPAAAVRLATGSTPLVPGDPDFSSSGADRGTGAYVDLGHGGNTNSLVPAGVTPRFHDDAARQVAGTAASLTRTYDTWSLAYEANGRDEDNDGVIDQALDGQDNDNNNVIDDPAEFETRPPYAVPLRGIEVRIRCYEPSSRQVRQVTIRHSFVPH
jgi:prepilin-type N-terminal cleavage/methylation domain-containing protein